ncbi:hypothetical protein MTYP_03022 [Methylophilaceae bacterium]|nr:hypothetical protein MTYP_03022 [Methylophilaceae bacterium]
MGKTFSPPKLLDQVRGKIRLRHCSIRTGKSYVDWIKRYILFHGKDHPTDLGAQNVEAFFTHLAVEGRLPSIRAFKFDGAITAGRR